jgi:ATP-binding cassette subfamily B protein IrtA
LFLLLGVGYSTPLLRISMYSGIIGQIVAGVDRIDSVLGQSSLPGPDTPQSPENYDIEFRDVIFSYDENNVLNQVNFKANEGCITALVGPSGAGKSTIAQLIPRFWDVQAGEILIGGVNIKQIPIDELMKMTSFVFQEVFMFNDTIYENIRMGKQEAAEEDIINAAKAAQAHQFIMNLPEGYHTVIGAGGTHLSGGEKQRISVARAILKDTPIIVLDEATTFTDIENEVKMQKAISNLLKNKTVIIIAHRLSTIRCADQILLINKGKIIERGKHETLVKKDGLYKKMWDAHISAKEWELEIKGDENETNRIN